MKQSRRHWGTCHKQEENRRESWGCGGKLPPILEWHCRHKTQFYVLPINTSYETKGMTACWVHQREKDFQNLASGSRETFSASLLPSGVSWLPPIHGRETWSLITDPWWTLGFSHGELMGHLRYRKSLPVCLQKLSTCGWSWNLERCDWQVTVFSFW